MEFIFKTDQKQYPKKTVIFIYFIFWYESVKVYLGTLA